MVPVDEPSKFHTLRESTDSGFWLRVYERVSMCLTPTLSLSYRGLGTNAIVSINPDVFSHDFAMLR